MSTLLAAFPDSRFTIDEVLAEGNKVVVRHHLEGTHTGTAFQGIPAEGKKVYVNALVTFRIENGKAQEAWLNADFLGMMMQLGAVPSGSTEAKN